MKPYTLLFLWLVVSLQVQGQATVAKADSLQHELRLSRNNAQRIQLLLALAQNQQSGISENLDSALAFIRKAETLQE